MSLPEEQQISVILPFRNAELFLKESIESIISQTSGFGELLLIDDHSSDRSREIAKQYTTDVRISLHESPGQGIVAARNFGISIAQGDYIIWQDADDISFPSRIEVLRAGIQDYDVAGGTKVFFRPAQVHSLTTVFWFFRQYPRNSHYISHALVYKNQLGQPNCIVRKAALLDNSYSNSGPGAYKPEANSRVGEDYRLWWQLSRAGKKFTNIKEPVIGYRQHGGQLSDLKNTASTASFHHHFLMERMRDLKITIPEEDAQFLSSFFYSRFPINTREFNTLKKLTTKILRAMRGDMTTAGAPEAKAVFLVQRVNILLAYWLPQKKYVALVAGILNEFAFVGFRSMRIAWLNYYLPRLLYGPRNARTGPLPSSS